MAEVVSIEVFVLANTVYRSIRIGQYSISKYSYWLIQYIEVFVLANPVYRSIRIGQYSIDDNFFITACYLLLNPFYTK